VKGSRNTSHTTMFCIGCLQYRPLYFFPAFSSSANAVCTECGHVPKRHTFRRDHKAHVLKIYNVHKKAQETPLNYTLRELRTFCLVKYLNTFAQLFEVWRLSSGIPEIEPTVVKKNEKIPFTLTNLLVKTVGPSKLLWSDTH